MISFFFDSLVLLFSSLDLAKGYNIILYVTVTNITKCDGIVTCTTVTIILLYNLVEYYRNY